MLGEFTVEPHWRPRFKWASQHNHGGHRPPGSMLATSEVTEQMFAVGQSNSGMVDPLHMTAITLTNVTAALLMSNANIDRTICISVMMKLCDEVGNAAVKVEHGKPAAP